MAPYAGNFKPFARASLALIGLAWTVPFLQPYHRFPLAGFYSEWLAFALGLAAALVLLHKPTWREAPLPVVVLAPVGLAAVLVLQAALGLVPYPEQALIAVLYLVWAALIVLLGQALRRGPGMMVLATTLSWWTLAGGILSAAVGLLQHFHPAGMPAYLVMAKIGPGVYGNLGQANHYATYLTVALACALYLHARGRLGAGWMIGCAALLLPPLALSGSRSIWLYFGALVSFAVLLHKVDRGMESRKLVNAALGLSAGFVVAHWVVSLPFAAPPASAPAVVTSAERVFDAATGMGPRLQLWRDAWRMFIDAPVLGAGFGHFAWHHFDSVAAGVSTDARVYKHAHNLVAHLMAETGAVGVAAVAAPLLAWLAGLRSVRIDLEWFWLLALLVIFGIHSVLEFPLWYAYFLGIAALLLGIGSERSLEWRHPMVMRMGVGLAILVGCLNLVAVVSPYREFERLVFLPERSAARPADDAAFASAIVGLYREPLLVPYVELAIAFGAPVDEGHLAEKVALVRRAVHFAPVTEVAYRYALLLALAGEHEPALRQLGKALRVFPQAADETFEELQRLARRYPGRFEPLLELAARARATAKNP